MRPRLNESTIATPGWAKWRGLNDRLAFGVPSVMAAYGRRADALRDYVASGRRPHAEEFLGWYAASHGVANVDSEVLFYRWRANGREMRERGESEREANTNLTLTTPPPTRAADRQARDPATLAPLGRSGRTQIAARIA